MRAFRRESFLFVRLLVMGGLLVTALRADEVIPIIPVTQWKVRGETSDTMSLSEHEGTLAVDFDVVASGERRNGPEVKPEARFFIERTVPLGLSAESARLLYETRIVCSTSASIVLRPLLCDANGEKISYPAVEISSALNATSENGWKRWKTNPFYANEAGGGLFDAEGVDGNHWPDGPLKLVGFEVRISPRKHDINSPKSRMSGSFLIGALHTSGTPLADERSFFVDSLVLKGGRYRLAWETRAAFQSTPVLETEQVIDYDPASESSRRQWVKLPTAGLHNSWLRYRLIGADGHIAAEGELRNEEAISPQDQLLPRTVDVSLPPLIGHVRLNPSRLSRPDQVGGIYDESEPFQMTVRVFPVTNSKKAGLRLKWTLTPYAYDTVLQSGEVAVSFGWWSYRDAVIKLNRDAEHDAYRFRYQLVDATDRVIDSGEYTLGVTRKAVLPRLTRTGTLPDRDDIKSRPYFRTTFLQPEFDRPRDEKQALGNFKKMLSESEQMTPHVTYSIEIAELEILPGVYDFALLDQIMDAAADRGAGVTIRVAHGEKNSPFRWHPYTRPRNYDGTPLQGHPYYGSYSLTDTDHVNAWRRCFRALHDRYAQHRAFEGYYLMKPGGEWILPEEPWNAHIADYSWSARESFRRYLRNDLKLDLSALNARWGTAYKKWDEVEPPQPTFEKGAAPDLRPQWIDFSRCKLQWNDSWSELMAREIRSYDPKRILIIYVRLMEENLERLAGLIDYQHNGGLHGFEAEGQLVEAWEKNRIGWITEPHYPHHWAWDRNGWVLDWSVYVMLAQAGAGGVNLHLYYYPTTPNQMGWYPHRATPGAQKNSDTAFSLAAHYGGTFAYDRFELFKTISRELCGMQLAEPRKQVAVIDDLSTLLTKHRTTFRARTLDLCRSFDLLKADSVDFEFYRPEHEMNYRMVVLNPLNEVLAPETIDAIDRMTRRGALLVINAHSGVYSTASASENHALLKRLGIAVPTVSFSSNLPAIRATAITSDTNKVKWPEVTFVTQREIDAALTNSRLDYLNWPYRWLPRFDSYGYYANHRVSNAKILSRFPDGGTAVSLHDVGQGRVLIFWGTLDFSTGANRGVMAAAAQLAGIKNPKLGNPVEHMVLASRNDLGRHYALLYQEARGTYRQKITHIPDGAWFVDDVVSGERLGVVDGRRTRLDGVQLAFRQGQSPLQILRFISMKEADAAGWAKNYTTSQETKP